MDVANYALEFYQEKKVSSNQSATLLKDYILGKIATGENYTVDEKNLATGEVRISIADGTNVTCTIDENGKVSWNGNNDNQTQKQWEIVTDYGSDGLSIGDLVQPTIESVASEKFYVIGKDDTAGTVTLLAEKCVKTDDEIPANNVQSPSANTLAFDSSGSTNVYANSSIKGEVDTYVGKLTTAGLTLEDVEINLDTHATAKGRLMWGTATGSWDARCDVWIYSSGTGEIGELLDARLTDLVYGSSGTKLTYWLGSPIESSTTDAWDVVGTDEGGVFHYNVINDYFCSLRPVIEISKYKIE